MKNLIFTLGFLGLLMGACTPKSNETQKDEGLQLTEKGSQPTEMYEGFTKVDEKDISTNLFKIEDEWALVTAGKPDLYNAMTISWGGFGTIWGKPVAFMTIRDTRYTFEFLQREQVYTLAFFDTTYLETLKMLGTKSGKDTEKMKESGLTALTLPSGTIGYKEANMIIECKKLCSQPLDKKNITAEEVVERWYSKEPTMHNLFFGEIIGVWKK